MWQWEEAPLLTTDFSLRIATADTRSAHQVGLCKNSPVRRDLCETLVCSRAGLQCEESSATPFCSLPRCWGHPSTWPLAAGQPSLSHLKALGLWEKDVHTDHIAVLLITAVNRRPCGCAQEPTLPMCCRGWCLQPC